MQTEKSTGQTTTSTAVSPLEDLLSKPSAVSAATNSVDIIFSDPAFARLERIAAMMAAGRSTIPKHLQGNIPDCFAVAMQAVRWRMDPFVVAQKTHVVGGNLGYESQLVNAVISQSGVFTGRLEFEWGGPWDQVKTKDDRSSAWAEVSATIKGESAPRKMRVAMSQAGTRNSPLWTSNPKLQLAYLATKYFSRLYCPDVILGVYTVDELQDAEPAGPILTFVADPILPEAESVQESVDAVVKRLETAPDMMALNDAKAIATMFKGADRTKASAAYKKRKAELSEPPEKAELAQQVAETVDTETGEITDPWQEEKDVLRNCKTNAELDFALEKIYAVRPDAKSHLSAFVWDLRAVLPEGQ